MSAFTTELRFVASRNGVDGVLLVWARMGFHFNTEVDNLYESWQKVN